MCFCWLKESVTSLGGREGRTIEGVTPDVKKIFLWLNLERTVDKWRRKLGVVTRQQLKRSSLCRGRWLKKGRQFCSGKKGWRPSVAAPGDSNPSDATGKNLGTTAQDLNIDNNEGYITGCEMTWLSM